MPGGLIPYPANHQAEKKCATIDNARKLFNRSGFDNVSLHEIMAGAGMTHGGFYSYFKSKSDLSAEVLGCFFADPNWKSCREGVKVDLSSTDVGWQVVRAYLSRQHYEDIENSCPMVALPTDVARIERRTSLARRKCRRVFNTEQPVTFLPQFSSRCPWQAATVSRPQVLVARPQEIALAGAC